MKKLMALSLALLIVLPVVAQPAPPVAIFRPRIRTLVALGKGIAFSEEDITDFEIVKLGIAKVTVRVLNETKSISIGVLWFGDERYKVKDIQLTNETIEANIYSGNETVGVIAIDSVVKHNEVVWVGKLELNGKEYNVFILEGIRKFKPLELKESLKEYSSIPKTR